MIFYLLIPFLQVKDDWLVVLNSPGLVSAELPCWLTWLVVEYE